jgi:hypothetical protein
MVSSSSETSASHFEVLAELDRILQSRCLRESKQLCALLSHAVHETLAGREDALKEYALGLQVFHRQSGYDPRNDAIVRVQASLLRKRLTDYYEHEGRFAKLRIDLPRGGYTTRFVEVLPPAPDPPPVSSPPEVAGPAIVQWKAAFAGLAVGIVLAAATALWLTWDVWPKRPESPSLWGAFVASKAETIVSFGVPLFYAGGEGFYVRDAHINKVTDELGRVQQIGEALGYHFRPQEDIYTGIGDAIGTHYVARWLESHGVRSSVANSNYIGNSDIEGKNLVVVSSARFQTLLQQLDRPNLFPFNPNDGGGGGGYAVLSPLPGELPYYRPSGGTGVTTSYAVLSLWPGNQPGTRLLYLSGIETWSTQGAAHYAIDPERLSELQRKIDQDPADGPRGRKNPYFQVLIRVEGKNNRVRTVSYVTHRYLPTK